MADLFDDGYATPEEAARGDIPERFVTILGVGVQGDRAHVWMLTNDGPPFEGYEELLVRADGRWHSEAGFGGLSTGTPGHILEQARRLGW